MSQTAIIVQARMNSSRLPGKMLKNIAGQPMLLRVLDRAAFALNADQVILATTCMDEDRNLVSMATRHGYLAETPDCDPDDVMTRYLSVAIKYGVDVIVRVTGDCPLIDSFLVDQAIQERSRRGVDYVALAGEWADGLDVEVFTVDALQKASYMTMESATKKSDREHVTPMIWRNPDIFSSYLIPCPYDLSDQRWCVDTEDDLFFVSLLYKEIASSHTMFGWREVYACIMSQPLLHQASKDLSKKYARNSGYLKSLAKEIADNMTKDWNEVRFGRVNNG